MSEVAEEHIQYSIEEIPQEDPKPEEDNAQAQEQTQTDSIHSPTKLPSVVSPENPFTSPFGSPTLVPRYGIAQTPDTEQEEKSDVVVAVSNQEQEQEENPDVVVAVSNQEQEEQEQEQQEEEDLSIIIKEEVIPENIESENLQKLMQLISKETPDVQFEEIYKDVAEPEPVVQVVKKEWTRIKGEDLYSKISSTKTNAIKLTEPPTPVPNPPNIKLTSNVSTPEKTQQDVPPEVSAEKTQQDAPSVVVPANAPKITPEIVFIIPYRDRETHRKMFADTMKMLLKKSAPYKIFYVHQTDKRGFNRGAMKNIGFLAVKKLYPEHYKNITLVFNDVDTMPTKNIQLNYKTTRGTIKHFYGFNYTLGGIVSINAEDFESLNGFPNFWAWGYEDNLLQIRAIKRGMVIDRSVFYKIHDPRIIHLSDSFIREVNREEFDRFLQNTTEGINSIEDLEYTINDGNGFIDVLQFNTTSQENVEKTTDYDLRNGPAPFKEPPKKPRRAPTIKMLF